MTDTQLVKDYLESKNYLMAILRVSIDVENMLFLKLFYERGLSIDIIKKWSLGKYVDWNIRLELVNKEWFKGLRDFTHLRNRIFHDRNFYETSLKSRTSIWSIQQVVLEMCKFLDASNVTQIYNYEKGSQIQKYFEDKQIPLLLGP